MNLSATAIACPCVPPPFPISDALPLPLSSSSPPPPSSSPLPSSPRTSPPSTPPLPSSPASRLQLAAAASDGLGLGDALDANLLWRAVDEILDLVVNLQAFERTGEAPSPYARFSHILSASAATPAPAPATSPPSSASPSPQRQWLEGLKLTLDQPLLQERLSQAARAHDDDAFRTPSRHHPNADADPDFSQAEVEAVADSLELLCGKLSEVERVIRLGISRCSERQVSDARPLIASLHQCVLAVRNELGEIRRRESHLRAQFDDVAHQVQRVKLSVRKANDLHTTNREDLHGNLETVRGQRKDILQQLEAAILQRNMLQTQAHTLERLGEELSKDINTRDHTMMLELASSKPFRLAVGGADTQENHLYTLRRISQLHRWQRQGEAKLVDVQAARRGLRGRLAMLVCSYY